MLTSGKPALLYLEAVKEVYPEFAFLAEVEIFLAMTDETITKAGKDILGMVTIPMHQSTASRLLWAMLEDEALGRHPDLYMILDEAWWRDADNESRVALIYHELYHVRQKTNRHGEPLYDNETGRPQVKLVGHDVEEFAEVLAKFGDWQGDYARMSEAMSKDADVASLTKCLGLIKSRLKAVDPEAWRNFDRNLPDRSKAG